MAVRKVDVTGGWVHVIKAGESDATRIRPAPFSD